MQSPKAFPAFHTTPCQSIHALTSILGKLALLSLGLFLCSGANSSAGGVRGQVIHAQGLGLDGVQLGIVQVGGELGPWSATTDSQGNYSILDPLIFGNIDVTPSKPGFRFDPPVRSFFESSGVTIFVADFQGYDRPPVSAPSISFDSSGAQLTGRVKPLGLTTRVWFEFGSSSSLGSTSEVQVVSGQGSVEVQTQIAPLPFGNRLHARMMAQNSLGLGIGIVAERDYPIFVARYAALVPGVHTFEIIKAAEIDGKQPMDFVVLPSGGNANFQEGLFLGGQTFAWLPHPVCLTCSSFNINGLHSGLEWTDLNGDSKPDLIFSSLAPTALEPIQNSNSVVFLINQGNGNWLEQTPQRKLGFPSVLNSARDWDHDGRPDLSAATIGGLLIENNIDSIRFDLVGVIGMVGDFTSTDVDHDGNMDLLTLSSRNQPTLKLHLTRNLAAQFRSTTNLTELLEPFQETLLDEIPDYATGFPGLGVGDFDGDGHPDLVALWKGIEQVQGRFYWNDGQGGFNTRSSFNLGSNPEATFDRRSFVIADFDNDGRADVITAAGFPALISAPQRSVVIQHNIGLDPAVVEIAPIDADGDGKLDLLTLQPLEDRLIIRVLQNSPNTTNRQASAPTQLKASPQGTERLLQWTGGVDDHTPTRSLTWNVRMGSSPGASDILSPLSDPVTGQRLVMARGNAEWNPFLTMKIPIGVAEVFWSVQAVDSGMVGGEWSLEHRFQVAPDSRSMLTLVGIGADGTVTLRLTGEVEKARLEKSDDLIRWRPAGVFRVLGPNLAETQDPGPTGAAGFYRAVQ